ncbi:restriction endonuclease subunit S [Streptococcus equinus]|uniref:Type I restriction enzyme, S subunit n=1 Tax=Streptococcus equinus TaxID=1335 RepID=A0A1G9IEN1_STREI|nr:restriction endonuclease subunit S [Streptococcus equinus]SDL23691.1 type I restriction enzyme, S subunit [Streptococcus equinus]
MTNKVPNIRFKGFTDDWEQRKAGEIFKSVSDKGYTDLPVLSASQELGMILRDEIGIDIKYDESSIKNYKRVKPGQFVIHLRSFQGGFAWSDIEGITSPAYTILDYQEPEEHCSKFWKIVLTSPMFITRLETVTYGIRDGRSISFTDFSTLNLNVPSITEQQKIGKYFSKLDNLITLHQRKCEQTKELKKFMLQKMFPKKGEKNPEIRFPGFTDDWEQRKLSELATMHARIGWQNLRTSEFLDQGDYMLVTGTDFENGSINFSTCHYVQKERYDQDKHIQISNGSILITKDGTLGKVAYVQGLKKPATLNAGVFNVEIKDENRTDGKYLFQYLKAPFLMEYVEKNATGGTIKHLNQNILVNFPVAISEKSEQQKIGEYFSNLDHLITLHQRKCEQLKELKKFMLQNMFPKKG